MLRPTAVLLLAALLLAPIGAFAQIPSFTPEQTYALRWYTIPLQHTQASSVVREMQWDDPDYARFWGLQNGVEHISAQQTGNSLWLRATPEGFTEVRRIVKLLDIAGYTFAPTLTFLHIPGKDSRLNWIDGPTQDLEISVLSDGPKIFQELTQAGTAAKKVKLDTRCVYEPIRLVVDMPRLRGDGSLTLDFTTTCWDGFPVQVSNIHPGDVLAVRGLHIPCVILIRVIY